MGKHTQYTDELCRRVVALRREFKQHLDICDETGIPPFAVQKILREWLSEKERAEINKAIRESVSEGGRRKREYICVSQEANPLQASWLGRNWTGDGRRFEGHEDVDRGAGSFVDDQPVFENLGERFPEW